MDVENTVWWGKFAFRAQVPKDEQIPYNGDSEIPRGGNWTEQIMLFGKEVR
jgi:hypothetical protein